VMRWVILAVFLVGMFAFLNWHEARSKERRLTFAIVTVVAFALMVLLGSTMV
jgi:hypothetical protein